MPDLHELAERVDKLRSADFARRELDESHQFEEAETAKEAFVELAEEIVQLTNEAGHRVNASILRKGLEQLTSHINQFFTFREEINNIVQNGVSQSNFQGNRQSITSKIKTNESGFATKINNFYETLRVSAIETRLNAVSTMEELREHAEKSLLQLKSHAAEATEALGILKSELHEKASLEASKNFRKRASHHAKWERTWLIAAIASFGTLVAIVCVIAQFERKPATPVDLVAELAVRGLVLSIPAIALKASLSRFNSERHLRILYEHRDTVLDQFRTIQGTFHNEQTDAKHQFQLEVLRLIFSDPETGYTRAEQSPEMNFHPVFTSVGRMVSSSPKPPA